MSARPGSGVPDLAVPDRAVPGLATPDLAVLGAGPAGVHAALAAGAAGLGVLLIDEAAAPGGQVYRAPLDGSGGQGKDGAAGDALRRAVAASGVRVLSGHRAWTVSTAPLRLAVSGPGPVRMVQPRAVLVAAGATERVVPFPGWTTPGVIGLAAATVLLKSPGPFPPGPVVVAGRGPLLAAVAAGLLERGVALAAVVDAASRAEWVRAVPKLLAQPGLLAQGAAWLARIRRAGVPVLHGHAVVQALGGTVLDGVVVATVTGAGRRVLPARLLAVGHGLVPATEAMALFGARQGWHAAEGAWLPDMDADGRTSVPGLYAAGDGTGIRGAAAAALAGRLAGLAAARDLGALPAAAHAREAGRLRGRLRRAVRAGQAMAAVMAPHAAEWARIPADTMVCRCEDVTRAEIDAVFSAGASDLNQLKARTRCGMGPCGGRVCAPAVAALAALHPHVAAPSKPWTVRPPLRPVPVSDLVGEFGYGEIPAVVPAI